MHFASTSPGFVSILGFDRVCFPSFGSSSLQPCESITEHFLMALKFPPETNQVREILTSKNTSSDFTTDKKTARSVSTSDKSVRSDLEAKPHLATCIVDAGGHVVTAGMTWAECVPDRFDISHGGSGVFLLSPYMPVHISFISYVQHFAFLLCNTFVAYGSHHLFPSLLSRCFPRCMHLKRPSPFWRWSIWLSHQQKDQHVRGLNNKIIFALGCWNSAATPWQFHLPWEREKNLAQTRTLCVCEILYVVTEISAKLMESLITRKQVVMCLQNKDPCCENETVTGTEMCPYFMR